MSDKLYTKGIPESLSGLLGLDGDIHAREPAEMNLAPITGALAGVSGFAAGGTAA
jgi:hypothetical protein